MKRKILLVDDEPHVIRIMRLALENAGYEVHSAANGVQALEFLQDDEPDVMITDIDMPRMNGRELCMEIGCTMPARRFPIYVLTSRAEHEHREWSGMLENIGFMEKPVSIRRLLSELDNYFSAQEDAEVRTCHPAR